MNRPLARWHDLDPRAQAVWAASFAVSQAQGSSVDQSLFFAERTVAALRNATIDESASSPEYEAARSGAAISLREFLSWYPVAHKIAFFHRPGYIAADEAASIDAFERYQRGSADFY